ncbi:MAG: hypothetical protein ACI4RH_01985, partial [Huintestinicola sp.]
NVIRISRNDDTESRIKLLKKIKSGVTAIMWLSIVLFYFLISYSNSFEITWLIFILGAAAQIVVNTIFKVLISRFTP